MKKIILTVSLFTILGFTSCKKENTTPATTTTNNSLVDLLSIPKISKVTTISQELDSLGNFIKIDTTSETLKYDEKGRLVGIYEYMSDNTIRWTNKTDNGDEEINTVTLDSRGLMVKWVRTGKDPLIFSPLRTPEGFMHEHPEESIVIQNGNKIKEGGETMEFYLDKLNTIGRYNIGISWYDVDDKNLIKSKFYSDGSYRNYSYEFDSQNRAIKVIEKGRNIERLPNSEIIISYFEYIK